MRAHDVIAVVAVILVGIGVTLPFFDAPLAQAHARYINGASVDVSPLIPQRPEQNDRKATQRHSKSGHSIIRPNGAAAAVDV
jgi:hypothetical protein